MRPNILLFVLDTARADAFEPYGAPVGASPVVAEIAGRGQVSKRAYSTANWTLPSHASLFTGLLPRHIGLGGGSSPLAAMSQWSDSTLAEVLRRSGYATFGVSANPWVSKVNGFDAGFDLFDLVRGSRRSPYGGIGTQLRWWIQALRARADDGLAAVDSRLRSWLGNGGGRPFFGFVNLMECHSPYLPPSPYNDLGIWGRWRAASDVRRFQSHHGFYEVSAGDRSVPPASMRRMRGMYASSIRMMDDWLGRVLASLNRAKVLDDTLVIVTADHGENFGESNLLGHVLSLDERLIRVPLVAAGPVRLSFDGLISLADVPRMIAAAVGIDGHPWGDGGSRSVVVAQDDGLATLEDAVAKVLMKSWELPEHLAARMRTRRDCATDGRYKLTRTGDHVVLHDLEADPAESVDVSGHHPDVVETLRGVLESSGRPRAVVAPSAGAGASAGLATDAEVDDLEERLRLLGYL